MRCVALKKCLFQHQPLPPRLNPRRKQKMGKAKDRPAKEKKKPKSDKQKVKSDYKSAYSKK
jgi:hypothetical protein